MLHSIWQMAVLLLLYFLIQALFKKNHPSLKRNILYGLILIQLATSIITFIFYYNSIEFGYISTFGIIAAKSSVSIVAFLQNYAAYIFYGYCLMIGYKMIVLLVNFKSFKNIYSKALIKPSAELKVFTTLKAYHFGIKKNIQLWYSNKVNTPLTFGFLKPVILLPFALLNHLTVEETEALIIHELTHIKNNDYLLNWILLITDALYFFNPFFKIAVQKIKLEREKNCDIQVLQFNYSSILYAEVLLKIESQKLQNNKFQIAAVSRKAQLLKRIQFFSNPKNQVFTKNNKAKTSTLFIMFALFFNLIVILFSGTQPLVLFTVADNSNHSFNKVADNLTEENKNINTATVTTNKEASSTKSEIKKITKNNNQKSTTNTSSAALSAAENYTVLPVVLKTTAANVTSKIVEVSEETSGGKIVTQVYKMELKNGKWIASPIYMTTEIKKVQDSLKLAADSINIAEKSVQ